MQLRISRVGAVNSKGELGWEGRGEEGVRPGAGEGGSFGCRGCDGAVIQRLLFLARSLERIEQSAAARGRVRKRKRTINGGGCNRRSPLLFKSQNFAARLE
jgi:hypothetical protein